MQEIETQKHTICVSATTSIDLDTSTFQILTNFAL